MENKICCSVIVFIALTNKSATYYKTSTPHSPRLPRTKPHLRQGYSEQIVKFNPKTIPVKIPYADIH